MNRGPAQPAPSHAAHLRFADNPAKNPLNKKFMADQHQEQRLVRDTNILKNQKLVVAN